MYQVIARKYRPARFSELIGQEHVRTTLENAIRQGRIAHGYILSGQRGTGKTTVARIIARCLNCIKGPTPEPCGECASCLEISGTGSVDVIEIDAASNRGINEMRELRDNIRYRPARDRYKVFIIDEAHQITSEAFNALLKTLEEPPEWVVFILCTTESHKIPVTIVSRCQQFSFRSVDFDELVARMRWICEQEGIQADDEVLGVIAQVGEGSVRDSLSALDQAIACCGTTLNSDELRALLGLFSTESLNRVTEALVEGSSQRMLEVVQEIERNGLNLQHFCRELARYFRNLLVARIAGGPSRLIAAPPSEQQKIAATAAQFSEEDLTRYLQITLDLFKDLHTSLQPRLHVEIGLLRLVHAGKLTGIEQALSALGTDKPAAKPRSAIPPPKVEPIRSGPSPFAVDSARKANPAPAPKASAEPPKASRPEIVTGAAAPAHASEPEMDGNLDVRNALLHALAELGMRYTADAVEHSEVTESNGELTFLTPKSFSLAMNETDLKKAAQAALGRPMRIKVNTGSPAAQPAVATQAPRVSSSEQDLLERALADPAVQSFREAFPDARIGPVRDLKD